ncbi:YdcF family protein [Pontibacter mangrovi]|uniref:YdcF family protein n=1 Tax=Pontibacter mangrovi TaxID=2589816 RepID=A0A501W4F8_9BACT|nr:YdcF family protein [Pontibacter mangrovi]TPE44469.1 YdcF family protein [Pontibacter mangrovi]
MFFILSKTLDFLLLPIVWVLLLLFLAVFLKSAIWRRRCLLGALAMLLLLSNPFLANLAWRAWEARPVPVREVGTYDVAVLLTGVTEYHPEATDRVHTKKGADRFLHTLQLYRLGKVNKILITGGKGFLMDEMVPEAEQLKRIMLQAGVPEEDLIVETGAVNTRENALNTAKILQQHPEWQKVLLVTSAFHMRRAAGCFTKAGVTFDSYPTDFYSSAPIYTPDYMIIPNAVAFEGWQHLVHEIAGYVVYKVLGYC